MFANGLLTIFRKSQSKQLCAIALLIIIGAISFGAYYSPAIYSDDWNYIAREFVQKGPWINWASARPLEVIPFYTLINIFRTNITAFYVVLGVLNIVVSIQLYFIARTFFLDQPIAALTIAAIFEIYPVIFIHMWLTYINYLIDISLILFYAWLLLLYIQKGHLYFLGAALLCLITSFTIVEAQMGIALAWCFILFLIGRTTPLKRRMSALLLPAIVNILFIIWRGHLALQIDSTVGYVIKTPLTPRLLMENLLLGLKVLIWGWTEPIHQAFSLNNNSTPMLIIFLIVVIFLFISNFLYKRYKVQGNDSTIISQLNKGKIRTIILTFIIGSGLAISGYIPVIVLFQPNLSSMLSRVNIFASFGASIMVVAILMAGSLLFGGDQLKSGMLMVTGAIPLVLLGVITQIWVQYNTKVAWEEQKQIWNDLIVLSPDLADDTTVYFVLPGYEDRVGFANWQRIPLQGDWDTTGALQVLYGNSSLRGDVIYPDIETPVEPTFNNDGIVHYWEGKLTPYSQTLFVIFNGNPKHLTILKDLQNDLSINWPTPTYKPYDRIIMDQQPTTEWRKLVSR